MVAFAVIILLTKPMEMEGGNTQMLLNGNLNTKEQDIFHLYA